MLGDCIFDVIAGIVEYLLPIIIVGGILSVNGKALDDDGDKTSLPDPIQGIAEATGIKMRWY